MHQTKYFAGVEVGITSELRDDDSHLMRAASVFSSILPKNSVKSEIFKKYTSDIQHLLILELQQNTRFIILISCSFYIVSVALVTQN